LDRGCGTAPCVAGQTNAGIAVLPTATADKDWWWSPSLSSTFPFLPLLLGLLGRHCLKAGEAFLHCTDAQGLKVPFADVLKT